MVKNNNSEIVVPPDLTIIERMSLISEEAGAIRKGERNIEQKFNFRGVDSVVNALSPLLKKYTVIITPKILTKEYEKYSSRNGANMVSCRLDVEYTFHGAKGDSITATVASESSDSGDKATAKAMSVAFRTVLLQAFALPTDEVDPDAESHERGEESQIEIKPPLIDSLYQNLLLRITEAKSFHALGEIMKPVSNFALNDYQLRAISEAFTKADKFLSDEATAVKVKNPEPAPRPVPTPLEIDLLGRSIDTASTKEELEQALAEAKTFDMVVGDIQRLLAIYNARKAELKA